MAVGAFEQKVASHLEKGDWIIILQPAIQAAQVRSVREGTSLNALVVSTTMGNVYVWRHAMVTIARPAKRTS